MMTQPSEGRRERARVTGNVSLFRGNDGLDIIPPQVVSICFASLVLSFFWRFQRPGANSTRASSAPLRHGNVEGDSVLRRTGQPNEGRRCQRWLGAPSCCVLPRSACSMWPPSPMSFAASSFSAALGSATRQWHFGALLGPRPALVLAFALRW